MAIYDKRSGFTIVELLIVIVVIAILAAITIVAYNGIKDKSSDAVVQSNLASTIKKLETAKITANGTYPSTLEALGITASGSTQLIYNYVESINYFCLESRSGVTVYHQTSADSQKASGPCSPTSGLIGWWPLNGSAINAADVNTSATISGATTAIGQNNTANGSYSFVGSSSHHINTNTYTSRNTFSFTVWAYPTLLSGYQTPLSEARDCCGTGYRGFELKTSYSTAGAASIALWAGGSGSAGAVSGVSSTLNDWNFFAGTFNGSSLAFYKNGVLISSVNYTGAQPGTPINPLTIGRGGATGSGAFTGRIDDVRVYDRVLSASEIQTIYTNGAE